ncbi:hypothetical protein BGZ46_005034 [Entomortierella lignicola]|nr:hypothetical protein BGZ46_005034 [Entomortierella lignicola]
MATFISRSLRFATTIHSTRHARAFHSTRAIRALNPLLRPAAGKSASHEGEEDPLFGYCSKYSTPPPNKFTTLHNSSQIHYPGGADKTVSALQGQLLKLLMRMTRPQLVLELGCFMGYSAMAMADGMPKGAKLYTCEKDPKAAQLARDLFIKEGYDESSEKNVQNIVKIELLEGDALSNADKGNYINYYNFILDNDLLSQNGYILADNVLFRGLVLQSKENSSALPSPPPSPELSPVASNSTSDIKQARKDSSQKTADHMDNFNKHVKNDPRVTVVVLPVFDGLSVIMKNEI